MGRSSHTRTSSSVGLVDDAAQLAKARGKPDLVIIVGDTAFSGRESEYKRASEWLDELTVALGCNETDVRVVPGNHDCDRSHITNVTKMVNEKIRGGSVQTAYGDLGRNGKKS